MNNTLNVTQKNNNFNTQQKDCADLEDFTWVDNLVNKSKDVILQNLILPLAVMCPQSDGNKKVEKIITEYLSQYIESEIKMLQFWSGDRYKIGTFMRKRGKKEQCKELQLEQIVDLESLQMLTDLDGVFERSKKQMLSHKDFEMLLYKLNTELNLQRFSIYN